MSGDEPGRVAQRYARRGGEDRYAATRPEVRFWLAERRQAIAALLAGRDLATQRLLEVGCGTGGNLAELIELGFAPQHLAGIELLPERLAHARATLPAAVRLVQGDASVADVADASLDIAYVSTVFSSLLDDAFQQRLANTMWRWLKPGGGVLWYDFTLDNPRNPDVRGMPLARVRALFPQGTIQARRVTLAPPLARALVRVHPALLPLFNRLPLLRSHCLAWIAKPP